MIDETNKELSLEQQIHLIERGLKRFRQIWANADNRVNIFKEYS